MWCMAQASYSAMQRATDDGEEMAADLASACRVPAHARPILTNCVDRGCGPLEPEPLRREAGAGGFALIKLGLGCH